MELDIKLAPEVLFHIAGFPVTNTFFWMFFLSLFLILVSVLITKRLKLVPSGLQNIAEVLFEAGWGFVRGVVGSDKKTERIFPLIFTFFIFILLCNLFVHLPGQAAVIFNSEEGHVPFFRAVMADYGLVLMLAATTVIIMQITAIAANGPMRYAGKFLNFKKIAAFFSALKKKKFEPGLLAQGALDLFLGIMEIVGEFAKVLSLSFRLFGNIFAGEVLALVMLSLLPFFLPLPFAFLELLTAVVQAFVFSVLNLVFINMASEAETEEMEAEEMEAEEVES